MEKKKYEELELEVVRLDAEDVITTSGGNTTSEPDNCSVVVDGVCEVVNGTCPGVAIAGR